MLKPHAEPKAPKPPTGVSTLLALGFRPLFSGAAIAAVVLMVLWLVVWSGKFQIPVYYDFIGWHSHEMLFGYAAAAISGFLLTAVRNWTGVNTPSGTHLGIIVLLWLAGRIAPFLAGILPAPVIAILDLAFLPAVAHGLYSPLWQGQQKVNRIFVPLILLMALANLLIHLQALGVTTTAFRGTDMMLNLVLFVIIIIGGRIIPFFTENGLRGGFQAKRNPNVEKGVVITLSALILVQLLYPNPLLVGVLAGLVAITQLIRLAGWHTPKVWGVPILWVLHAGYIWIVVGFALEALAAFGLAPANLAKHALTIGGVGGLTVGMMARVSLGHTGRSIDQPPRIMPTVFVLLNITALLRVFGPMLLPEKYNMWIHISGGLWAICFLGFAIAYIPMLLKPRLDGKPG
ncbi:MAG: NnrS family protein [Gammaproteobacteria bacterium]|nr:NnrS family protein [Gammaproteobacteria bacterium]